MLDYQEVGQVAVITLDDGKANAFGFGMLEAINNALDRATHGTRVVVLIGRSGILSGGFDLKVIKGGDEDALKQLVTAGVRTLMRFYGLPIPLVTAATGHAVALGAFTLLASDYRFGAAGDFKIGLNETAIGLTFPAFGLELAEARLSRRYLAQATLLAHLYAPAEAVAAGFLDEVLAPEVLRDAAVAKATELTKLHPEAFANSKQAQRGMAIARVLKSPLG
jgi:enoyl-CoA hydratase